MSELRSLISPTLVTSSAKLVLLEALLRCLLRCPALVCSSLASAALESELGSLVGPTLITSSAKLVLLEALLRRLKASGSRVLLFSQLVLLEALLRRYKASSSRVLLFSQAITTWFGASSMLRLDGSYSSLERELDVRKYNAPDSPVFIYTISTRAGGVGLNLATADCVVDLQAIARSHRIGQTKQVRVFRLVTEDTAEERSVDMSHRKIFLSDVVVAAAGAGFASTKGDAAVVTAKPATVPRPDSCRRRDVSPKVPKPLSAGRIGQGSTPVP
eukprot:gene9258-16408_t